MHRLILALALLVAFASADRGLELSNYRTFPQSRQRDYPWENHDFCVYDHGSLAISGFGQIDTSFPNRIYYATSHVVGWCTYNDPTYVNYVYYATNRGARNATFRLHPSQNVAYISRWEDQRVFYLPISNTDYVPSNPPPESLLSANEASWPYLELDASSGIMWAVGNQGPTVVKLGWHKLPTSSLDFNVRSLSAVVSTNCYTIFFTSTTAYFGCFGSILYMPKSNNPIDGTFTTTLITSLSIGAGQYQCGAIDTAANRLYLGSTIGLGLEWDTSSNSLLRIFFLTSSTGIAPLRTVVLDKSGRYPVLWWATGDSRVIRVNTRDFSNIFAQANASRVSDFRSMAIDPSSGNKLLLGQGWTAGENSDFTYLATRTDCSLYSCSECLTVDLEFCGVCVDSGLCTTQGSCSTGVWRQDGICPRPLSLNPSSGSIAGGTSVTYLGTTFEPQPTTAHRCKWTQTGRPDVIEAPASGSAGTITCISPSSFVAGTAHLSILLVTASSGTREYSAPVAFEMYNCASVSSCSECSSSQYTECGWCLRSASCSAPTGCPNSDETGEWLNSQSSTCPAALSVVPSSIGSRGGETVTVTTANILPSSISLNCKFGPHGSSDATRTSTNTFTCPTPALPESTFLNANLSVPISLVNDADLAITVSSASVELYNCSAITKCSACRATTRTRCGWLGLNERRCIFQSDLGSGESLATTCPSLSIISPPSLESSGTMSQAVILTGTDLEATPGLQCIWSDGASQTFAVAATRDSASQVTCQTPPGGLSQGQWYVALGVSGVADSNQVPFLSYDCASSSSCDVCLDPLRTACRWCRDLGGLACASGASNLPGCTNIVSSGANCPHLTATDPASLLLTPNIVIDVIGTHYLQNTTVSTASLDLANVQCAYELSSTTVLTPVVWNSDSSLTCDIAPSVAAPETAHIYITDGGGTTPYTNRLELPYVDCNTSATCGDCLARSQFCNWCGDSCSASCPVSTPSRGCPTLQRAEPDHASILGDDVINIVGENLLYFSSRKRASPYTCDWGGVVNQGISVSNSLIQCITPAIVSDQNVSLTVLYNGSPYLGPMSIAFFSCPLNDLDYCGDTCLSNSPYCGWCVGSGSCGAQSKCPLLWQSPCTQVVLEPAISSLEGGSLVTATLSSSLPDSLLSSDLSCAFGTTVVPASFTPSGNQVSCTAPARAAASDTTFQVLYGASNAGYSVKADFSYVDCASRKSCDNCIAASNCGWCGATKKCSLQNDCGRKDTWSNKSCPVNALALGLGLGLGLFVLLLLAGLIAFLIRRRRVQQGLIIDLEEPDYLAIAFGSDVTLAWRVPEHNYKLLDTALARRDFLLQLAIGFNCPATEQDALAKALVYVASKHGVAAEMIQTCIRSEVRACKHENTLFRNNSVASRMYKFYSRIVGIKYLFNCIARVILELEVLGREQISVSTKKESDPEVAAGRSTSLLSMSMELDQTKALDDDMDTETNLLQLQLICQKLLNVLIKTSVKNIPSAFRKIFVEIDNSVMGKFAGSNEAVYKGIGGLFFLRFVCPAITAPHVYGLLKNPPNTVTQRQLVLISKVIQSIANMQPPGKKEEYMNALTDFINQAIPRIIKFYDNLRQAVNNPAAEGGSDELEFEVPDNVHLNGLATTWNFLWTEKDKLKSWAEAATEEDGTFDHSQGAELIAIIDDCAASYPGAPKKIKTIGTTVPEGKEPRKKKKKPT